VIFFVVIAALLVLLIREEQENRGYEVRVRSDPVAVLATHGDAVRAVEALTRQAAKKGVKEISLYPDVTIERVARAPLPTVSVEQARKALEQRVLVLTPAWVIIGGGRIRAAVRSKREAQECLQRVRKSYGPGRTSFKGRVQVESLWVPVKKLLSLKEAVSRLRGASAASKHRVAEGETAQSIAKAHRTTVEALRELNPKTDLSDLKPGMELSLPRQPPLLTVVTVRNAEEIEQIPFATEAIFQPDLRPGENPVLVEGRPGSKKVEYLVTLENGVEKSRKLISSTIIEPPVARQVAVSPRLSR
jgi:LysM repeat protein